MEETDNIENQSAIFDCVKPRKYLKLCIFKFANKEQLNSLYSVMYYVIQFFERNIKNYLSGIFKHKTWYFSHRK